jgi:predicted transcriptional regulator
VGKEYRSRNRILLDLLRAIKNEPGIGTTRLLFLANLSHERLQEYLQEVLRRAWVQETLEGDRRTYAVTPEGQRLLGELDRIDRFMQDFGMGL